MYRLAHVTDPHFRGFRGARPWMFLGKRAVGGLNILVNRWRKHRMELLEAMGAALRAQPADHLALTGDLSNVAIPGEWAAARAWIERYAGPPEAVTVIPGNHDVYTPDVPRTGAFEAQFSAYQTDDRGMATGAPYPFVRFRGPLALVGVSTCVPTGDLGAWGQVGAAQLQRLEAALADPAVASRIRVVLIHHPPVAHRPGEHRNLRDRDAFAAVIARTGADLILHGHDHRDEHAMLAGPGGVQVPAVGAGSASYAGGLGRRARFNVYEFADEAITAVTWAHDPAQNRFVEVDRVRWSRHEHQQAHR